MSGLQGDPTVDPDQPTTKHDSAAGFGGRLLPLTVFTQRFSGKTEINEWSEESNLMQIQRQTLRRFSGPCLSRCSRGLLRSPSLSLSFLGSMHQHRLHEILQLNAAGGWLRVCRISRQAQASSSLINQGSKSLGEYIKDQKKIISDF